MGETFRREPKLAAQTCGDSWALTFTGVMHSTQIELIALRSVVSVNVPHKSQPRETLCLPPKPPIRSGVGACRIGEIERGRTRYFRTSSRRKRSHWWEPGRLPALRTKAEQTDEADFSHKDFCTFLNVIEVECCQKLRCPSAAMGQSKRVGIVGTRAPRPPD